MSLSSPGRTLEQTIAAIEALDLAPIKFKATRSEAGDGYGWSPQHADRMELAYKRYLILHAKYPDMTLAPERDIDRFWHMHILDTRKYAADCEATFGHFLHHFPYLGLRGEGDEQALQDAFEAMQRLYAEEFGESMAGAQTNAAWCSVEKLQAQAAWCSIEQPAGALKSAWCSIEQPKAGAKAAWCSIEQPQAEARAAWCSIEQPQAKAAWCSIEQPKAEAKAAWCSIEQPAPKAQVAWCSVEAPKQQTAAWCSIESPKPQAAWCSVETAMKAAWCSIESPRSALAANDTEVHAELH
jgi:hypothetical protein